MNPVQVLCACFALPLCLHAQLLAVTKTASGQFLIQDGTRPVLQYNYRTVEPGQLLEKVTKDNLKYARARSDYIHPLYDLNGNALTRDWSIDHPHHRGIYWAWPEVDFGTNRGDLHALQKVFARPTGKVTLDKGDGWVSFQAENEWRWEDREPIVRETVEIRSHTASATGRFIDLRFTFIALKPGVTVARRGTDQYGGLNVRMETPREQKIFTHTDPSGAAPRRAWSDLSGSFGPADAISGLMLMQHPGNPDYPGDWIQYPELSWCQPTFPAAGTRFALSEAKPLVLRFRLWVHAGGTPSPESGNVLWDDFAKDD